MKLYKAGAVLQILHCAFCFLSAICMSMYTAFYPAEFSRLCFTIGAILIFISSLLPIGLLGTILNYIGCFSTDLKESTKHLVWTAVMPALSIAIWLFAIYFFVYRSGGV